MDWQTVHRYSVRPIHPYHSPLTVGSILRNGHIPRLFFTDVVMPVLEISVAPGDVRTISLKPGETIVGRDPVCDVPIDSGSVSRRHARIFQQGNSFYVDDLQSVNGTYLNRDRIRKPTPLSDGDTIHFYRVSGTFRVDGVGSETAEINRDLFAPLDPPTPPTGAQRNTTTVESNSSDDSERLKAILQVVESLGRSLDLDEVLANILDGLFEVFSQSRRGNIWLIDRKTHELELRATKQTGSQTLCSSSLAPLSSNISRDVIAQRQAVLSVDELSEDAAVSVFDDHLRSSICAPLLGPGEVAIGAICIDSDDGDDPFDQQDLDVLTSVSAVASQGIEYARQHARLVQSALDVAEEKAKREHAERELEIAESIQRTLYPSRNPELAGFDIAGKVISTEKACGDYYDFIPLHDGRLAIAVADVSGHGLGAALHMVQTRSYIQANAELDLDVAELMTRVNRLLCIDLMNGAFVTMFLGVIDPVARELTWASAGHPGFRVPANEPSGKLMPPNVIAGWNPKETYESVTTPLNTGDIIILPTDGVFEAGNPELELFGVDRMLQHVEANRMSSSAELIDSLYETCRMFAGDEEFQDDMTCVLIKVV